MHPGVHFSSLCDGEFNLNVVTLPYVDQIFLGYHFDGLVWCAFTVTVVCFKWYQDNSEIRIYE